MSDHLESLLDETRQKECAANDLVLAAALHARDACDEEELRAVELEDRRQIGRMGRRCAECWTYGGHSHGCPEGH